MKPVHSAAAKVRTGLFASFESRTSTAAVTFATSTQWPAAALRVLLRQVRLAYRMTVPFQDGCASISAHQAAADRIASSLSAMTVRLCSADKERSRRSDRASRYT